MSGREDLIEYLKQHPALLISSLYVLASAIGMSYAWAFLREFGINVFNYSQISDFLVASLKEPSTWAVTIGAVVSMMLDNAQSRRFGRKPRPRWIAWYGSKRYRQSNYLGGAVLVFVLITLWATYQADKVRDGHGKAVAVSYADGDSASATLLGTTGQWVFLYDAKSQKVLAHPLEAIEALQFYID